MLDRVLVLVDFFGVRALSKVVQEEFDAVVNFNPGCLQEQTVLQSSIMLQLVFLNQRPVHLPRINDGGW